jgi:pimeloyl-ACP methyl ester carboxylesterase
MLSSHRQTLNLPSLQLSYLEWHQGTQPLLLLHGLADCSVVWASLGEFLGDGRDLANRLRHRYHIIAPDLRGHGDSSKPNSGYSCDDIIADLEALIDSVSWTSTHVVAHSWSAKVAAIWARQQPQRFRSLVLVDPFFIGRMPSWMKITFPLLYQVLPFLKLTRSFSSYAQAERQARQLKQYRGWSELQQAVFQAVMEQKPDGSWGSKFVTPARDEIFTDVMQVAGLTQTIEIPTLFVQPQAGLNRTAWQLQPYRHQLKNLQIQQVPGNHWCFLVEPEAFNQAVAEFLDKTCGS